eukprot:14618989-Ditylum_brightwellii.AAC.1
MGLLSPHRVVPTEETAGIFVQSWFCPILLYSREVVASYAACKFTTKCNHTGEVMLETQTGKKDWEETFMETVKVSWGECSTCKRVCEATEKDCDIA